MLTDGAETEEIANDFINRFGSPTRRVISADISQESAVIGGLRENRGRSRASAGRGDRLRRAALVRWR